MNTNKENIPSYLFDYLELYRFDELNKQKQDEVLKYFTKEEYEALNDVAQKLKNTRPITNSKEFLTLRFEKKHGVNTKSPSLSHPIFWKWVAVFLVCGFVVIQYLIFNQNKTFSESVTHIRDTVYIVKNIISYPVTTHDTVYLKYAEKIVMKPQRKENEEHVKPSQKVNTPFQQFSELNIVSIKELNDLPNNRKGRSIKDDTLLNSFEFVKL